MRIRLTQTIIFKESKNAHMYMTVLILHLITTHLLGSKVHSLQQKHSFQYLGMAYAYFF